MRFNVACSRDILKDAVNRLKKSSEVNEMENERKKDYVEYVLINVG